MTDAIEAGARAFCQSRKFETGQGTCAVVCMDQLGDVRKKGCGHCARVHGKLAEAVITAAIASGALVPASAVAEMKERCAKVAEQEAEFWPDAEASSARVVAEAIRQDLSPECGGYVVVPREPHDDTLKAGYEAWVDDKYDGSQAPLMYAVWIAMLNAASSNGGGK